MRALIGHCNYSSYQGDLEHFDSTSPLWIFLELCSHLTIPSTYRITTCLFVDQLYQLIKNTHPYVYIIQQYVILYIKETKSIFKKLAVNIKLHFI